MSTVGYLTCVSVVAFICKWCILLRFDIACSILKMECVVLISQLQGHSKVNRHIIMYEKTICVVF